MAQPPILIKPPPPSAAVLAEKVYSLDALRTAVDDAAKASGPLWVSYILALFYFLIAAGGVTHKDMFLERPVKLPFLGVDRRRSSFASRSGHCKISRSYCSSGRWPV